MIRYIERKEVENDMIYDEGMSRKELKEYMVKVIGYNEELKCEVKRLEDLRSNILYNYHDEYEIEELNEIIDDIDEICMRVSRLINKKTLLEIKIRAMIDSYDVDEIN